MQRDLQPRQHNCRQAPPTVHKGEMDTLGSAEPTAMQELPGVSVSMQTEASWLREHACGISSLSEEFSSLDVLCAMEFKEEFVTLFKKSLRTLPSVGLPTLLAYRPESLRGSVRTEAEEDAAPRCEFCGSPLRPFPPFEDVFPPPQDRAWTFCCERSRDLYEFIVVERRSGERARSVPSATGAPDAAAPDAVTPHEPHGTEADRRLSKDRAYQRQQERRMARQLAARAAGPGRSRPEGPGPAGTISYLLSQEPPAPRGWTLLPGDGAAEPAQELQPDSVTCCDFSLVGGKVVKNELLEKYYKHGGKFLTVLPDGTAQLFYPSGNLAIIVVREKNQLICIVQEDKPSNGEIQAVFSSSGRSTCYHPNGSVWVNTSVQGGQHLDRTGGRVRRWMWPHSVTSPGPQVPLSPTFLSLNRHVGVRILGQDKITVSFLAMGQQAKFNVGTRVQVGDGGRPPPPAQLGEDELLLLAFRVRILRLFDRLRGCLSFPSNEQWDKIKPPAYLITQTLKILQLCTTSDVSDELRSSVRAIVNAQV
ncbi:glutamate-rich protein 6 isoform X3 [Columba livia]|uniref:glutamate-rich protein 6 isoform X3 n=1 Tax=Columba livia TaxID=8932 RepID=UPI0031BB459A